MKCQYEKPDGTQCSANAMAGAAFCFSHNPETQEDKAAAVLKGGQTLKPRKEAEALPPLSVKSTQDVLELIQDTINRVRTEPMTHQKANCIGYLANIALKAMQVGELDEKLELINTLILERKTKMRG